MARAASRHTSWSTGSTGRGPSAASRCPPGTTLRKRATSSATPTCARPDRGGRPQVRELLRRRAPRPRPRAAAPKAATTSRRRAAPSGAKRQHRPEPMLVDGAAAGCRAGPGARTAAMLGARVAERPRPALPLRRQLAEVETGALRRVAWRPTPRGRHGAECAPCSAMCRRMSAARDENSPNRSGDTPPRSRPAAREPRPNGTPRRRESSARRCDS